MNGLGLTLLMLAAAPEQRGYAGVDAVQDVAGETSTGEVLPVPAEPVVVEPVPKPALPVASAPSPGLAARQALAKKEDPRPKWWGPYPRPKLTGFGGPVLQLTGLTGAFAAMVGLAGGLTIRQRVSVGATALWLLNPQDAGKTSVGAAQRLNINFGGLLVAVVVGRTRRIDFTLAGVAGGGGACLQNPETGGCYARTAMFVGQPQVGLHIRLAPVVRLAFALGYRFVAARNWSGPGGRQLGAPVGMVMLEFGLF